MKKLVVTDDIFELYPNLNIGIIICQNLNNQKQEATTEKLLANSIEITKEKLGETPLIEFDFVKNWRLAYKKFGEKKNRSSVEALLRRVANGKDIPKINPLVDIYNAISIKYWLPVGGEDLSKINGNLNLTIATGNEIFKPLGTDEIENPVTGEVMYRDDANQVVCRSFNWRESDITKLTEQTTTALLIIECISSEDADKLVPAITELNQLVTTHLNCTTELFYIHPANRFVEFDA